MPSWIRSLLVVQAAGATLYAVLLVGGAHAVGLPLDPDSWWPLGVFALTTGAVCAIRALQNRKRRVTWALLSLGLVSYAAGFVSWAALYEHDANPPYPSLSEAGWLPFMVILVFALVVFLRAELPPVARVEWLDALIPACAVSAFASQLLLPYVADGGGLAQDLTLLAYPSLDIVLIAVTVLALSVRHWEPGVKWALLSGAVFSLSVGDFLWSYLVAAGTHEPGTAADIPYLLTFVALSWVAWIPTTPQSVQEDDQLALALPALSTISALGLLFYGAITADLIVVSLLFALVAVSAGVIRWSLALRREAQAVVLRDVAAELARKAEQQAAVADLGGRAIATADVDELMTRATGVVASILRAERVAVLDLTPSGKDVTIRADTRPDQGRALLDAVAFDALDAGTPVVLADYALCATIERKDGWGMIVVLHPDTGGFGDDDVSFVQAVANVLSAVLTRAREEQLEAQLQQSRRLESVGKLAGGVAHDFNNLLAIILNYADFAREAATDEEQRRDLEELSKAAARGAELVSQLLVFSRRTTVDAVALDVCDVVRDTEPMLRRTLGEDVNLRCRLPSELPLAVIDPGQLTQVLVNLAVNARDAMPYGGTLTIEATTADERVRLLVADTGIGMTEDTRSKAFDPFFTTKPPGSGTGLGLATVYGIVTQAGGSVELYSQEDRGTRVVIELPCGEGPRAARPTAAVPAPEAGSSETVLVVEDDPQVRGIASRILRSQGYRVLEASSGEEALVVADSEPGVIHLLLSDVIMPGMSGVELAEDLRTVRPSIRVLHMSGYTSGIAGHDPRAALPELIEKPFTAAELLARVRALLEEPKLQAQPG